MRAPQPLTCTQVGTGPAILVLHAYGMQSRTYLPLADELAGRARVVIPDLFALSHWVFDEPQLFARYLDQLGLRALRGDSGRRLEPDEVGEATHAVDRLR
jgi:hypothetical protein